MVFIYIFCFAMRINCSIDGKHVTKGQAVLSVFDNSLFYADGLFETLLAVENRPVFLHDHIKRLKKGAELIHLKIPFSLSTIESWTNDAVKRNKAHVKKVRITVTSGNSAFWAGKETKPKIIIIVTEFEPPVDPFRLRVSPFHIDEESPFRNVKTLSFIIEMTSRRRAYMDGFDDAILLNRSGNIAEATSANIFWVKKGILFTTPLSAGCLDGMSRKHILALAKKHRIPAFEKNIDLQNLLKADEIFVTSSLKLILPITQIQSVKMHKFAVGKLTLRLQALFKELVFMRN